MRILLGKVRWRMCIAVVALFTHCRKRRDSSPVG
jgi:hypothetical protein